MTHHTHHQTEGTSGQMTGQGPGQMMESGQTTGHQMGGQQMSQTGQQTGQSGQQMGFRLDDAITSDQRMALDDLAETIEVCEWCAEQCIEMADPSMIECIRLCRDTADVAALGKRLLARDSRFAPEIAETFARVAGQCAEECAQHPHDHCQECATTLSRAVDSTGTMLDSLGRRGQMGMQSTQMRMGQGVQGQMNQGVQGQME